MATAKRIILAPPPPPPPPSTLNIQLTLTEDEAQALMDLIGRAVIGGGRRYLIEATYFALSGAGISCSDLTDFTGFVDFTG